MKKCTLFLLSISLVLGCSAPLEKPIHLAGPWYFKADTLNAGVSEKWFSFDFNFAQADTISLQESWESLLETDYDGVGWYFCEFSYPPRTQPIALCLQTFDDPCQIWLNGTQVGEIPESSELMKIELTQFILQGRNRLVILINDLADKGGLREPVRLMPFRNPEEFEEIK